MAGASVITSGEIQQQQPNSIADMLQNVPGVASEVTPNDPGQSINIRGMQDFGRVNILIDGARQDYQISGHNANGTFYLDPQFVGQADIVRGPVSNIYGSSGIGGVVSFSTQGVDSVLNADEKYGALQRFIVGTNDFGRRHVDRRCGEGRPQCRCLRTVPLPQQHLVSGWKRKRGSRQRQLGGRRPVQAQCAAIGRAADLAECADPERQVRQQRNEQSRRARFDNNVLTGTYTLGYTYKAPTTALIDLSSHVYYATTSESSDLYRARPRRRLYRTWCPARRAPRGQDQQLRLRSPQHGALYDRHRQPCANGWR